MLHAPSAEEVEGRIAAYTKKLNASGKGVSVRQQEHFDSIRRQTATFHQNLAG